jgi:hypothetical protein
VNVDFGAGFIPEFEKRFGKTLTKNIVLFLVLVAVVVFCLGVIWRGVRALYQIIGDALPNITFTALNVLTAFYVTALIAIAALLFPAFQYFVRHRRVPQSIVDALAELRAKAISDILNGRVTSAKDLKAWETEEKAWRHRVSKILEEHFPKAELLGFQNLGVIQPTTFPHAFNNEHNFYLSMFSKRLSILEDIIRRHTR